ncbi:MAG: hypothetical protein LC798_13215 [Chloroflexi bacterium]|nr:hypothetical protein [Chloroflexota bacterium]
MRRVILSLILLAASLVLTAPAYASDPTDHLNRAAAYWGAAPVCEAIEFVHDPGMRWADAYAEGCRITVTDAYLASPRIDQCRLIVHEWGHLLGHGHDFTADPAQVMPYRYRPDGGVYVNLAPACEATSVAASYITMLAEARARYRRWVRAHNRAWVLRDRCVDRGVRFRRGETRRHLRLRRARARAACHARFPLPR